MKAVAVRVLVGHMEAIDNRFYFQAQWSTGTHWASLCPAMISD